MPTKMKILYLAPHLSTGGMPAFLLRRIQEMQKWTNHEIFVVEWTNYSDAFTIQRDKIKQIIDKDHYICLGDLSEEYNVHLEKRSKIIDLCYKWNIDIIHIDEIPEEFDSFSLFPHELQKELYDVKHPWRIIETCHNSRFKPSVMKKIMPDAFALVSYEHKLKTFKNLGVLDSLITFPHTIGDDTILKKREDILKDFGYRTDGEFHIINIGLWTAGKNQSYALEIAQKLYLKYGQTYQFHFIGNQAPNFEEYWEPLMKDIPPNCRVWGEREDTSTILQMSDVMLFTSLLECNPIVLAEAASFGLPTIAYNLPQYGIQWDNQITHLTGNIDDDINNVIKCCSNIKPRIIKKGNSSFAKLHEALYKKCMNNISNRHEWKQELNHDWNVEINKGCRFFNQSNQTCNVQFRNQIDGTLLYETTLNSGFWGMPSQSYFIPWQIDFRFADGTEGSWKLDLKGKIVNIEFGSSSLGDSLAFIEAVVEFKNKLDIKSINLLTYKNWLFDWKHYNKLGLVKVNPNTKWPKADAHYEIGVYMDEVGKGIAWHPHKNKRDWRAIYLGDIATDALGLESIGEVRPSLDFKDIGKPINGKYIVIATQSTVQAKYWNNPAGWQEIVDWHRGQGYNVYIASNEEDGYMGNFYPKGCTLLPNDLNIVSNYIRYSDYFIGISSGLSWLAWALNSRVVLISGFTPEITEFTDKTLRIIDKTVCNSCWLWDHFDKNKWNWCPKYEGTERQFECTKSITGHSVIEKIQKWNKI